jgi:diketogulonate reductase-like aldo/keto reductase
LLFKEYLPVMQGLLGELRAIATARKKTVAQVALNWNMQKGFLVLVGVRDVQQV